MLRRFLRAIKARILPAHTFTETVTFQSDGTRVTEVRKELCPDRMDQPGHPMYNIWVRAQVIREKYGFWATPRE